MDLKTYLKGQINSENYQGVALRTAKGYEVDGWHFGETELNKFELDLEIEQSMTFSCINGNFRILD
jgi:hypothetical protein